MESARHLFDIPDDVAYLNAAYMGPQLHAVTEAAQWGLSRKARPWTMKVDDFFAPADRVRGLVAKIFDATAADIALMPSVSYGIETAVANTPLANGQNVVVLAEQFPSNVYPWRAAAERVGASVRYVPRGGGSISERVLEHIDGETAAVSVAAVHWTDGERLDLSQIRAATHEVGAQLVLDLTQSLGAMPFSVKEIDPDFAVAAGYKWLLGPYATAYFYAAPRHHAGRPLENGWITREGAERFAELVHYRDGFAPGARRFDMGERSNFLTVPMCEAALTQILEWGVERLYEHLSETNLSIAERASALGFSALPPEARGGHYLGLIGSRGDPQELAAELQAEKIYVSVRGQSIRVTPHVYTTQRDIDRFFAVLEGSVS